VYEFEDDDYESEIKIWTLMDGSESSDNTTSSEVKPINIQHDKNVIAPILHHFQNRNLQYVNRNPGFTFQKHISTDSASHIKANKIKKKGNILHRLK
jgi:hypothetical protein